MEIIETPEGTLFVLEKPFDGRSKWLFAWYALSFLASAIFLIVLLFLLSSGEVLTSFFVLAIAVVFTVAAYRYLSGAWRRDTLLVRADTLVLTEQKGFRRQQRTFQRSEVSGLRWLDQPVSTPHPLAGKTFDYLGFQTQEQVINALFSDHRIAFDYKGQALSFGRTLYSWDYDAILAVLSGASNEAEQLPWNEAPSWERYWTAFDAFVQSLRDHLSSSIVEEAQLSKQFVNGLTDGWGDHRQHLRIFRMRFGDQLTEQQLRELDLLIDFLSEVINLD